MRRQIRAVMGYAGPRMVYKSPLLTLVHGIHSLMSHRRSAYMITQHEQLTNHITRFVKYPGFPGQNYLKHLLFLLVIFSYSSLFAVEKFYFIIRVDDIQSRTNWEPRRITDFQEAVESRGGKVSWAVIPHRLIETQNSDGQLIRDLKASASRGHEIVLHGYNHICPTCGQSGHEMYCSSTATHHSYEKQAEMIRQGMDILWDSLQVIPRSFVPPGHKADTTTFRVLLDHDIDVISTIGSTRDTIYEKLYNLAPNSEYTWTLSESDYMSKLQSALSDIESMRQSQGYYCLLLHDPFIRQGYENGRVIAWTAELMDSLMNRYGRGLAFVTLSEAAEMFNPSPVNVEHAEYSNPRTPVLHPNFPNPFNPSTSLSYSIPQDGHTTLTIFDISGKPVIRLMDTYQAAGNYSLHWDGTSADGQLVSSGVYLFVLRQADKTVTRKMILMK
jgi:predicted deacetylase